jgi:hypothetical protein
MSTTAGLPTLALAGHTLWLGPHLTALRTTPADDQESATLLALDDRHVVRANRGDLRVVDVVAGTQVVIASDAPGLPDLTWERATRVLALRVAGEAHRYQLDAAFAHVTALPAVPFVGDVHPGLRLCDPERAGGLVAITIAITDAAPDGLTVLQYRGGAGGKLVADKAVYLAHVNVLDAGETCDVFVWDKTTETIELLLAGTPHAANIMQVPDAEGPRRTPPGPCSSSTPERRPWSWTFRPRRALKPRCDGEFRPGAPKT